MNVLFVCTGNVCRSPMAEGFLRFQADRHGLDVTVRSTGTHAWAGRTATIDGRRVMQELGVPIDDHRTLTLDRQLVVWADLVLGLAAEHTRDVRRDYPEAAAKTFNLKDFLRAARRLPDYADAESWVRAAGQLLAADGRNEDTDVHDPLGERQEAYRRVALEIQELIEALARTMRDKGLLRERA